MNRIIIPTDFSKASEKSLEFGIEIAKKSGASILLMHSIYIPVMDLNVPANLIQDMYQEEEKKSEKILQELCGKIKQIYSDKGLPITCEYVSQHNAPVLEIERVAKEHQADLVILGTKGRDDFWGFMGSTTMKAMENLNCPVLVVKEDSDWGDFKKVYCGVETVNEDLFQLRTIIPLLKLFQSEISILHIEKHAKNAEDLSILIEKKEEAENFLYAFAESTHYSNLHYRSILNEDPSEGIGFYMEKNNPDLLVLLKYQRNWLSTLFHQSLTKKIITNSNIPVLILSKKPN